MGLGVELRTAFCSRHACAHTAIGNGSHPYLAILISARHKGKATQNRLSLPNQEKSPLVKVLFLNLAGGGGGGGGGVHVAVRIRS